MKLKLVYFTLVDITAETNGADICCRNHIKRLSNDTGLELFVIVFGLEEKKAAALAYLNSLQVPGKFIVIQGPDPQKTFKQRVISKLKKLLNPKKVLQKLISIMFGELYTTEFHLDQTIIDTLVSEKADILLIDSLYSTAFCRKAIRAAPKAVLVTFNREAEFYWEGLKSTTKSHFKLTLKSLKMIRFWLVEYYIYKSVDMIIALSPPDVPKRKGAYITPYLDIETKQWKSNSSRTIFFVGGIVNYANKEAIEYIICKLAPAVTAIMPDVRFKIIGASNSDISFHHPSVELLGKADADAVEQLFLNCQLFICPVKNTHGLKFKMAKALSYGTPFLASPESMEGIPHLKDQPTIPLDNPKQAARTIRDLILDEESTTKFANSIRLRHDEFINTQSNIWSRTLRSI